MLHVNILAGAILKFIKVRTYGTDPVHLEFTKFKGLVLLSSECWDEESKKKFFFCLLKMYFISSTLGSLSNIRGVVLSCLQISLQNFFSYGL